MFAAIKRQRNGAERHSERKSIMPIELRTQRDGSLRDTWYGRYEIDGKRFYLNLGVKWAGTPPESHSLRDTGDSLFERSRATAIAKLDSIVEEARSKRNSAQLIEKLYEIKTGEKLDSVKLAKLDSDWAKIPRNRPPKARYAEECQAALLRFVRWVQERYPKVVEIGQVTRTPARAYMEAESARGVTPRTWNGTLKLLRSTFRHSLPPGCLNPFADMPVRSMDTVFRKPFSPVELKAILEASQDDDFIRPILVVGSCTAMRRGDCCLLKWSDVDLGRRFITVKTAKTGQTVSVPIFPLLLDELAKMAADRSQKSNGYVFPEQAKMYLENPDGITRRVRKVFAAAGFRDMEEAGEAEIDAEERESDRTDVKLLGNPTTLSGVRPSSAQGGGGDGEQDSVVVHRGEIHAERKKGEGVRRASVRDFHSFRVTWVTLALTAGVPLELVQKVTGHKTTDIVLKHYFQPGREDFRRALQSAMPKLLTNGQISPKDEMRKIVKKMAAKTWKKDKTRLLSLLDKL
jgi:integrase